jgi:hypothetical protein
LTPQSLNPSLLMILLVYNAENYNIGADSIPLHCIHINHWPPDSRSDSGQSF